MVVETNDEDTCTGLVFKRQRVGEAAVPSASTSGGTPAFRDHPPSASSPLQRVVHEGGGESALEGQEIPSTSQLPVLLQRIFNRFQDKEVVESSSGNLSQDRIVNGLGDFVIASNLALSKAQEAKELKAKMAKLEEELSLNAKTFANRETAMYVELESLLQVEKDAKKALKDKS